MRGRPCLLVGASEFVRDTGYRICLFGEGGAFNQRHPDHLREPGTPCLPPLRALGRPTGRSRENTSYTGCPINRRREVPAAEEVAEV